MAPQAAGGGRALRRRGSGPGRGARDNAAEAGRASRVADSGCSAPARAAPPRHRPPAGRPRGAGSLPRAGRAGVLQSGAHRAAAAQRVEGRGRRAGRRQGGSRPDRQVWGARSARVPRWAPPARLLPAMPPARPATPGAAAASWRCPPGASLAARSEGWTQKPQANQERSPNSNDLVSRSRLALQCLEQAEPLLPSMNTRARTRAPGKCSPDPGPGTRAQIQNPGVARIQT